MPAVIELVCGSRTDVGRVRAINEDSLLSGPPVFLVADGMGGYQAGDVASATVVDEFSAARGRLAVSAEWVTSALERANQRVVAGVGGGTTVTGAAIVEESGAPYWLIFNVGDSRVYRSVNGDVHQVTVDHSVVQELVDEGKLAAADARLHPDRNIVTRALGSLETMQPDYWLLPIRAGERLVLCSDGVTSELDKGAIVGVVGRPTGAQETADDLVDAALQAGGRDNVTVLVVDVLSVDGQDPSDASGMDDHTVPRAGLSLGDDTEATSPRADAPTGRHGAEGP